MEDRSERFAPIIGIVFAVLFYVTLVVAGETPDTEASPETILDFYDSEAQGYGTAFAALIMAALTLFFAGGLRARLQRTASSWLSSVALGGAVIYAVGLAIVAMTQASLADAADDNNASVVQVLNILDNSTWIPMILGIGTVMLATGWHAVARGSFPKWFGWVSVVIGILAFAGPGGFIAFLTFPLWVLGASVLIARSSTPGTRATTDIRDRTATTTAL